MRELRSQQANKLRGAAEETDNVDDDFSDEEITEEEIASVINTSKNAGDVGDSVSIKSDADDVDVTSSARHHDKTAFKLKNFMQTMEMFSLRAVNDGSKV